MDEMFKKCIMAKRLTETLVGTVFDTDKLFTAENLLSKQYKDSFIDGYIFLKLTGLWDNFVMLDDYGKLAFVLHIDKDKAKVIDTLSPYEPYIQRFFEKQLSHFCKQLGIIYFEVPSKNGLFIDYSYMLAGEAIQVMINIWDRKQYCTMRRIIDMIMIYYSHIDRERFSKFFGSIKKTSTTKKWIDFIEKTDFCFHFYSHFSQFT